MGHTSRTEKQGLSDTYEDVFWPERMKGDVHRSLLSNNTNRILFMPWWDPDRGDNIFTDSNVALKSIREGAWGALMVLFFFSPLVQIQSVTTQLGARNRDLNPIGNKSNIRQNFGSNSRKFNIRGFISPLDILNDPTILYGVLERLGEADEMNDDGKILNIIKLAFLKRAVFEQKKFLIVTNEGWDVVTIDDFTIREDEKDPHVYRVELDATSVRNYGKLNTLEGLLADGIINNIVNQIVDITF